jgi:nitric oxide synthase-interacting protein
MNNLLAQRQEIKRLEREMERRKEDELEAEEREDEEVRERAVREFELVQLGIDSKVGGGGNKKIVGRENGMVVIEEDEENTNSKMKGTKRKFELDEAELLRIAKEDRLKYRKELDDEKVHSHYLPTLFLYVTTNQFNRKPPPTICRLFGFPVTKLTPLLQTLTRTLHLQSSTPSVPPRTKRLLTKSHSKL